MALPDRYAEQRKSCRFSVPDSRQEAELKVGRRRWPIRLFNESSGGFAAWIEQQARVKVEDVVELITPDGSFQVRVVYVAQVPPHEMQGDTKSPTYRLGLERLTDVDLASEIGQSRRGGKNSPVAHVRFSMMLTAIILFVVVGAASISATIVSWHLRSPSRVVHWRDVTPETSGSSVGSQNESLTFVVRRLGLSQHQEKRIQQVAETTARSFQELDAAWKNDPPEVRLQKQATLIDAARREIFRLLSPEQRERWKWLVEPTP